MSKTNYRSASLLVSVLLLAPTVGILLTSTALAQEDDIRVLAVYSSFADIPADPFFSGQGLAAGYRFVSIPAIILGGATSSIEGLRTDAHLTQIVYDAPVQFHLETAVVASKARDVWGTAWHANSGVAPILKDGQPIDGRGVTVGIVDSGANALHPDLWYAPAAVPGGPLQPKIVACVHTLGILGPAITVPTPDCDENVGHGTHVAGIVAGNGMMADMGFTVSGVADYNGAAPGAQLAVAGLGVETIALGGLVIDGLAGLDWQYANADLLGIRVVTNSWSSALGCTGNWNNDGDAYHAITNKLVQDKGITVLWASNNNGGGAIGTSPQGRNTLPGVIMVANYDDKGSGTRDGDVAGSSGDGCVTSGGSASNMIWTWPDVAAPGSNIVSTAAGIDGFIGMAPVFVGSTPNDAPYYTTLSGTSMATPHVAGVAALLYQAYPEITPAQVEKILIETAKPFADGVSARGVAGTTPYWGPASSNNYVAGFTDKSACQITPAIAARAEANDPTLDASYPGFRQMVQPRVVNGQAVDADANLYICRDFKRGHGLVDAEAAVRAALKLAGDDDPTGTPEVKITTPAADAVITDAQTTITGLVDRLGAGPNVAPTATLAAGVTTGPAPLGVDFSLAGSDADGVITGYTLAFGDGSAPVSDSVIPSGVVHHDYTATGSYTATFTVTDDESATGSATLSINVGGLPIPDGTVTGEAFAYNAPPANVGVSNVAAIATGAAGDGVPKYPPGVDVFISVRNGASADANVPIDTSTPGRFMILKADGTTAAGPITMTPAADTDPVTSETSVRWVVGQFTIPATWSGRYYFAPIVTVNGQDHIVQSQTFNVAPHFGLKPIDVIGSDAIGVPGLPGTTPGSDEGHSIGDADDDGLSPFGEIQWADTSSDAAYVTAVIKLGAVPVQPAGDSPFVYELFVNDVRIESFLFGTAPSLWDVTNGAEVIGGITTWSTTANTITLKVPVEYLNTIGVSAPYTGHVEAMVGEGLAAGIQTVDRAPNAGERTLAALWQQPLPTLRASSSSDPDNTDPAGDSTGTLPFLDVIKAWVSRESATEIDLTIQVTDLASSPPSVDAGLAKAATNYGAEFCVDNAAQTFTATSGNYAALSGVTCYRLSATNGALGVAHSGGSLQTDGSGSCGQTGMTKSVSFNTAANTITWTVNISALNVDTTGAAVANCNTTPPTHNAPLLVAGNKLSRLVASTGMSAGAVAILTLTTDSMNANDARTYTLGGTAPALVANAGADVSGLVGDSIAIAGGATGGSAPYTCSWSASGGTFANAAACTTSVSFATAGVSTLTLTVTDNLGATAVDTAVATVTSPTVERVTIVVGGSVTASAPVDTSSATTDTWDVSVDLSSLPNGETHIVATWYAADGTTLASATRRVNIQLGDASAFVDILSPDADSTVSGQSLVSGSAGHVATAGSGGLQATNHYGLPLWSGQNGGRAAVTLDGFIEAPCATCAPGQLSKPNNQVPDAAWNPIANNVGPVVNPTLFNNLATSTAWLAGPDSPAQGLDGYWFDITGHGGDDYELTDASGFGVFMDIRFSNDWSDAQSAELGATNGPTDTKTGTVPATANWAFVYIRMGDTDSAFNQFEGAPSLKLTPQIVPPGAVQALAATSGPNTVVLTWAAPLNDGGELTGYKVQRDGADLATVSVPGYVDTPGDMLTHVYAVTAFNSAGNGAPSAVNGVAGAPAVAVAITSPSAGAVGVSGATSISGTYMPGSTGGGGGGSGAFANTHYVALLNLNSACGDPLGYGDHVIINKLTDHAVNVLGMPVENVHIYNEKGVALTQSIDSANYNKLTSEWKTGAVFDGKGTWGVFQPALRSIAATAAAGEAAGGAPARIFFIESSHGLQASLLLGDGATDSIFCLDDADVSSTMLGDLLNDIDANVAAAHAGLAIEWSINIDCSFCGGFVDSPLPAPGVTAVNTAGVVGPNRVVEVGCTWVTECFGNPAVTYDYMFNECTFTGKADGYGPLVETLYGTGTDGSDIGYEVLVGSSSYAAKDGAITLEESYWCAIETAHASFTDPIAIQQMFQISDNLQSDMFGLSGFPLWESDSSIDLGQQDPSAPLDLTKLPLADVRAADPTGDAKTPFSDLVSIEAAATTTEIVVDLGVADLTLSSLEFEDEIQYDFFLNGDHYSACYLLGSATLWGWDIPSEDPVTGEPSTGASSAGTLVYDTANGLIHLRVPISELTDQTLPASVYATSIYGDCGFGGLVDDDRIPDGTGVIMTSEDDDNTTLPGADKVTVALSGPATVSGDATLTAAASTWTYDPAGDLADGLWTATATLYHNAGSGFVQVGTPSTIQFRVGVGSDLTPPTAPVLSVTGKTTSTVSLSWTASTDNVGVDRYEVRRGGVAIGTTTALNYVDTGLAASTTYSYVIKAFDAAGNNASSTPKVATTEGISNPTGLVTLYAGSTLLGTAEIDTSSGDPVSWEILVDWTSLPEGATQIIADYDDGAGLTASDTINVFVTRGVEIDITSPAAGADVMPTFTTSGTVEGAGGPQGVSASSYMFADGTLNKYHPGYMLAQTNVIKNLETALKNAPGFLGVAPDLSGKLVVNAYFTGAAPAVPNVALPEGWTLKMNANEKLERAITKYPANFRVREGPPAPAQAQKLGPGSHLIQVMPTGTFGCTANFVWKDQSGKYYLGAAGHCFLPEGKTSTHGADKDYDRNLTSVKVCVSNCQFGGQMGFIISGNMVTLGKVAYARQTVGTAAVGNDFGIVEIPVSLYDQVRAELPVWNGPTQLGTLTTGEPALLYGNSVGFGEVWPTMARGGFGAALQSGTTWSAVLPSAPGDSGSALVSAHTTDPAGTIVEGFEAIGALTHLSGNGPVVGTTMARAKAMVLEAGLTVTAQMQGAIIAPPAPTVPDAPTLNTLTPGSTTMGVAWTAPTNDGNSAITGYSIRYGTASGSYTGTKNVTGTSATVTGLAPATQYYFVVKAVNAVGASVASNEQNAYTQVVVTVPGAPQALQAVGGDGQATLAWDAPASNGGAAITSYTVSYTGGPSGSLTTGNVNQATVSGLTNGVTYTFTVSATNSVGSGPASNQATATPTGGHTPAFTVEVRADASGVEVFGWTPADSFDGSSFSHEFSNAPGGALTVTARLLQDGVEVRSDSVAVHVLSAPELTTPASVSGNERQSVQFTATATDADGPAGLTFSLVSAPANATIGAASGAFSWTPDYGQDGTHTVTVKVTDPQGLADQKDVELVIGLANKPPVMGAIGNKLVGEGETLSFTLTATDRENDALTFSSTTMPAGATLDGVTGAFSWTPAFGTEANYPVTFLVSDGVSSDSKSIVITVGNVNRPPVLDAIGAKTVAENAVLSMTLTGSDPDLDLLTFSATGLPAGAVLTPAGAFLWTPTYTQAGSYAVTFTLSDGELTASELVMITVTNVDRAPVLTTIPNRQVLQLTQIRVPLAATDPDTGDVITWEFNGPATAAIENGANGFATLVWTPTLSDLGARTLTVVARSGPDALIASQSFVITVNFKTEFTATHFSSSYVEGSPSQVVTITANITNTGPQTDTFALSLGMSALWKHSSLPSTITLAPGETAQVSVNVTFPTDLALSYATISATSVGNASKMRDARFRLDVPVNVAISAMGHLTNAIDVPTGTVHVTHYDGTPAVGAVVTVTQMHVELGGQTRTSQSGVTDANGDFAFDLSGDAKSVIPGKHQLVIVGKKVGGFEKSLVTTYTVGTNAL